MLQHFTITVLILTKKTFNEAYNESALDEKTGYDPYQFKIASLLPE